MHNNEIDGAPQTGDCVETSDAETIDTDPLAQIEDLFEDIEDDWVGRAVARIKQRLPMEIQFKEWIVGDTVDERYQLVTRLGSGAFGVVFKARDNALDREVAIKLLHPTHSGVGRYQKRFEQEARVAARVVSDHVVTVHNVGTTADSLVYIVMELVNGTPVSEWQTNDALRSPREIATVVVQAAKGLFAAHQHGLIHRDIKCSNLLIDNDDRIKVSDFGLAIVTDPDGATMSLTEQFAGTLPYMSPEQLTRPGTIDHRSDIYSLGVVLYELLGAARPFRGIPATIVYQITHVDPPPLRQLNPSCPRDLATITEKCLRKQPDQRYQNAKELVDDLQAWLDDKPILARPTGRTEKSWRWCRRNPVVATLSVFTIIAAIASTTLAINLYLETRRLDRALNIGFQLLKGVQDNEFETIDDAYSGILQGSQRLSDNEREAVMPLFTAALDLQEAASLSHGSAGRSSNFDSAMHIAGQARAGVNIYSALRNLNLALSRSDQLGLAWLLRAQIRQEVLDQPKADVLPDWEAAIALLPDCSAARSGRGWCYMGLKQIDKAIDDLETALELDPTNEYAHYGLANIMHVRQEYERATIHYEAALSLPARYNVDPNWKRGLWYDASCSHWGAAAARHEQGNFDEALRHAIHALEWAEAEYRSALWPILLQIVLDCEPETLADLTTELVRMSTVDDSSEFQFTRRLIVAVALARTGLFDDTKALNLVDDIERQPHLTDELNKKFHDRFDSWVNSMTSSEVSVDLLQELAQSFRRELRGD
ncbi:MAG: protein kinase [Planctomycetales bacterium]|nr:protein kinase [Planctomycetales bacterium]